MVRNSQNLTLPLVDRGKFTGLGVRRIEFNVQLLTKYLCKLGYVTSHQGFFFFLNFSIS